MSTHRRIGTWRAARDIVEETVTEGAEGSTSREDPPMAGGLGDPNAAAREQRKAAAKAAEQRAAEQQANEERRAAEREAAEKAGGNG